MYTTSKPYIARPCSVQKEVPHRAWPIDDTPRRSSLEVRTQQQSLVGTTECVAAVASIRMSNVSGIP